METYAAYVQREIERGEAAIAQGRTVAHEDVKTRIGPRSGRPPRATNAPAAAGDLVSKGLARDPGG